MNFNKIGYSESTGWQFAFNENSSKQHDFIEKIVKSWDEPTEKLKNTYNSLAIKVLELLEISVSEKEIVLPQSFEFEHTDADGLLYLFLSVMVKTDNVGFAKIKTGKLSLSLDESIRKLALTLNYEAEQYVQGKRKAQQMSLGFLPECKNSKVVRIC